MTLKARIAALIEAQGPMSVAQFMTIALLDPKDGYYATRDPFGAQGDFTTAPEVSQMFGEMLGLWMLQAWADLGLSEKSAAGRTGSRTRHADGRHAARRVGRAGLHQ
jgi:SAM-dependent MidA family methyltransferase